MESQLAQVAGFRKRLGIAVHALSLYYQVRQLCEHARVSKIIEKKKKKKRHDYSWGDVWCLLSWKCLLYLDPTLVLPTHGWYFGVMPRNIDAHPSIFSPIKNAFYFIYLFFQSLFVNWQWHEHSSGFGSRVADKKSQTELGKRSPFLIML